MGSRHLGLGLISPIVRQRAVRIRQRELQPGVTRRPSRRLPDIVAPCPRRGIMSADCESLFDSCETDFDAAETPVDQTRVDACHSIVELRHSPGETLYRNRTIVEGRNSHSKGIP